MQLQTVDHIVNEEGQDTQPKASLLVKRYLPGCHNLSTPRNRNYDPSVSSYQSSTKETDINCSHHRHSRGHCLTLTITSDTTPKRQTHSCGPFDQESVVTTVTICLPGQESGGPPYTYHEHYPLHLTKDPGVCYMCPRTSSILIGQEPRDLPCTPMTTTVRPTRLGNRGPLYIFTKFLNQVRICDTEINLMSPLNINYTSNCITPVLDCTTTNDKQSRKNKNKNK